MVIRALKQITCICLLVFMVTQAALGCFGPKLFFGYADSSEEQLLFAMVSLYVKEKTGVECTVVEIDENTQPLSLIDDDKVDLVLVDTLSPPDNTVFNVAGYPVLVSGKRPFDDLQFTTVLPAIKKLNRLLTKDDLGLLLEQVRGGEAAMAVARRFFMERRWI